MDDMFGVDSRVRIITALADRACSWSGGASPTTAILPYCQLAATD